MNKELYDSLYNLNNEISKNDKEYAKLYVDFLTAANNFAAKTSYKYMPQKTIEKNKLSIRGFVMESDFVKKLNEAGIFNFTFSEIKEHFVNYQTKLGYIVEDINDAFNLYNLVDGLANNENKKLNMIVKTFNTLFPEIKIPSLKRINKDNIDSFHESVSNNLKVNYLDKNLINNELYVFVEGLYDYVFNFIVNGYKQLEVE